MILDTLNDVLAAWTLLDMYALTSNLKAKLGCGYENKLTIALTYACLRPQALLCISRKGLHKFGDQTLIKLRSLHS